MQSDTVRVVSHMDPAIDAEGMGSESLAEYIRTRNYDLLKFKPGKEPMAFTLREIPQGLMIGFVLRDLRGDEEPGPREWARAFSCGVQSVMNLLQRGGVFLPGQVELATIGEAGILSDKTLDRFELRTIFEVGAIALTRSFLALTTDAHYPLPRLCHGL